MELTTNINITGTTRQLLRGALSTEVFGGACVILVRSNRALLLNIKFKSYYEKQKLADNRQGIQTNVRINNNILELIKTMAKVMQERNHILISIVIHSLQQKKVDECVARHQLFDQPDNTTPTSQKMP